MERGTTRERLMRTAFLSIATSVAVAAMAACTPTPTPEATASPPPSTAMTIAIPELAATAGLSEVQVAMNVGGSLRREDDHTVRVAVWQSNVGPTTTVTFTVSLPCASTPLSPTMVVDAGDSTFEIPMQLVNGNQFAGVIANAAERTLNVISDLCSAGPDTLLKLTATWGCGAHEETIPLGALYCESFDISALVDPRGGIDIPLEQGSPCQAQAGRQVNIYRVKTEAMPAPLPTYPFRTPNEGWVWLTTTPSVPYVLADAAMLDPHAATQFSGLDGQFAWDAAPTKSYFLEVVGPALGSGPSCRWYSPVFTVVQGQPITDLDLHLLNQWLPSCSLNPTCP